ncbi:hypothetical protein DICVIV_01851 [Dictyocaulus viviparus]|uniref:Cationic amino acid transporter C-terminal domain-containing protein n=1 Tax=Dictyocaulus viviparus TaxID=29172 RepID=A0A0D8Y5E7_DICVI|nr:hypothetical protein DICVIV_01851 [Dictyocaulus viviparus]
MADDGLIFLCFARINKCSKVPLNAIIVFTILNAVIALVFDLSALVEFLSIGTLLAYSMVSACVLLLRHQAAPIENDPERLDCGGTLKTWVPFRNFWRVQPSGRSIFTAVFSLVIGYFWLALTFRLGMFSPILFYVSIALSSLLIIISFLFICGHEQNSLELNFKVPFVPFIPCLGLLVNVFMMSYLDYLTWIRFVVWMLIGLTIYFFYGIRHSKEGKKMFTVTESNVITAPNYAKKETTSR